MLRALYSGISGMKVNQTKLDVIGNNIANVNTVGFKSGRVRFEDMLSQRVKDAASPAVNEGGVNPSQVGLGVKIAGIDTLVQQGLMQSTGRSLDVGIDGDGYFMVGKGPDISGDGIIQVNQSTGTHSIIGNSLANSKMQLLYSRDGSFTIDNSGNLVTSDGSRVMGYSLTNDSPDISATNQKPDTVTVGGFNFSFGPGTALNGYNVALGVVGPGTATSASVDKDKKLIVVNGDFSTTGAISTNGLKTAITSALSSAGIAQSVDVTGSTNVINGISSSKIAGGANEAAPGNVTSGGFTFSFNKGSVLNGYNISLGNIGPGQGTPTASVTGKNIVINGDFTTENGITSNAIEKAINGASGLPSGAVIKVSGSPINIGPSDNISGGVNEKTPTPASITLNGVTFNFPKTATLNSKVFTTVTDTTLAANTSSVSISGNTITIKHNGNPTDLAANLNSALYLNGSQKVTVSGTMGTTDGTSTESISGGLDRNASATLAFKGLTFNFNYDNSANTAVTDFEALNSYKIVIGNMKTAPGSETAVVDSNTKTITINADFTNPQKIDKTVLQTSLKTELTKVTNNILGAGGNVAVTGNPTFISGTVSSYIDGGYDLKSPGSVGVDGMTFSLSPGAELNGYTIQLGNVQAGTKTSADIDTANKKIIINGYFSNELPIDSNVIASAINNGLSAKGISQYVSASGASGKISNTQSVALSGGTPAQSIDTDGVINFVDATKEVNSYDGSLKSLKIPDKVRIPGTDSYLSVKSFNISKEGLITGVLEDGSITGLGQIAVSSFKNPAGLTKSGNNLFVQSSNSGDAIIRSGIGTIGEDNSTGFGDLNQGMLEMSNVDLAEQFTDMIEASRAFQANGKTINTGDEILQDIINLKR